MASCSFCLQVLARYRLGGDSPGSDDHNRTEEQMISCERSAHVMARRESLDINFLLGNQLLSD